MAVSSTELGPVTREKGPLGHGPCQKPEQVAFSDARLVRGHCYVISPLCHWSAGPSLAPARLGSCTLPWTPKVTSSAYLLTGNLLEVTLIN